MPAPREVPHQKRMETSIGFDASGYPKNMVSAGQLSRLVSSTISNIKSHSLQEAPNSDVEAHAVTPILRGGPGIPYGTW
jgi:hypothetical protein